MLLLKVRKIVLYTVGLQLLIGSAVVTSSCSGTGTPNVKVQFVNPKVGWIVGKNLWRTEDGGVTWTAVRGAGFGTFKAEYIGYGHRAIQFVDPEFGIQLGAGVLAKTVDGGQTWSEHPLPEPTGQDIPPQTVVFLSRELGWLIGQSIYRTNDGAKTWQLLSKTPLGQSHVEPNRQFHPTYADYMPALWFTDSSHGVMAQVMRLRTDAAKRFRTARSGLHLIFKLFQRYQKIWSSISAAEKLRDVLEQAKQKEKPIDKMSKNETDTVAIAA